MKLNQQCCVWKEILEIARFAPSPHNVQPWWGEFDKNSARVYIIGERTFPFTDYTGSFIISAMMMFLNYVKIAAQNLGYRLEWQLEDVESLDLTQARSLFATLELTEDVSIPKHRFSNKLLTARKTSRKANISRQVPDDVLSAITAEVNGFSLANSAYSMHMVSNPDVIDQVLRRDGKALAVDVNDDRYFGELRPLLRLKENATGLHYRNMEMPKVELAALKYMPWALQLPVLGNLFREVYHHQLGHAQHMAFICGDFWQRSAAVNAGTMLINMWLKMSEYNVVLHPFGNLVTNKKARKEIEELLGIQGMWFVCRLGYTDEPPESNRYSVEELGTFS